MEGDDTGVTATRSSGRVRRAPAHYTPQQEENGKRKREGSQQRKKSIGHGDEDDSSGEDSDEDTDGEPDEEEIREHQRKQQKPRSTVRRRPAAKKTKINTLPIRSAQRGGHSRLLKRSVPVAFAVETSIPEPFRAIFDGNNGYEEAAAQWLKDFDEDQPEALAAVVNLVLVCAGCHGAVDRHDILDTDAVTSRLDDLRDEHQASNPTDYPIIAKNKTANTVRQGLCGFLQALIKTIAANSVLYEEPSLVENLHNWLSTMSSAPNRPFRHTATVASLAVATALCDIARENADELAKDRRHAENEKAKSRPNKARVKQLEDKFKTRSKIQTVLEALLKDWFDTVFIHRYRDVDPLVRRDCMSALGEWVSTLPDVFLNGSHLRYFGWVLGDPSAVTRAEVVKQLLRLYREKTMLGGLKTFTEKFRPRLVEIATTDADTAIRITGVQLLEHLRDSGLLEPNDIDDVGKLIFDTDSKVRKAVAGFFADNVYDLYTTKVDELGGTEALTEILAEDDTDRHDRPKSEWLMFKALAETLQSYNEDADAHSDLERLRSDERLVLHLGNTSSRFMLAAEAVYQKIGDIQNWQILAGYLLYDHSVEDAIRYRDDITSQLKQQAILDSAHEPILLEVLTASVKWQMTELETNIMSPKKPLSKREKQQLQGEQEDAARQLIDLIPRLLKKFGDTSRTAGAVLGMEPLLSLQSLSSFRQDSTACAAMLDDIRRQFMTHATDEVLGPASAAILHAKSYGELDDLTEERIVALWDDVSSNFLELVLLALVEQQQSRTLETFGALNNNLLRLTRLATISDCTDAFENENLLTQIRKQPKQDSAIDYLLRLVHLATTSSRNEIAGVQRKIKDESAARAAEVVLFYFRWKLKSIVSRVTEAHGSDVPFEELERLASRRDTFVDSLKEVLAVRRPHEDISLRIAETALELHSSMAVLQHLEPKPGRNDDYIVLVMDCEEDLQTAVLRVFDAAEKEFARLSGKRLQDGEEGISEATDARNVDQDPMSDSDEETDVGVKATETVGHKRAEEKMLRVLMAEQKLCSFTGKIIQAVFATVMDGKLVRKRLERNRTRLGTNFKECISYLSPESRKKTQARSDLKALAPNNDSVPVPNADLAVDIDEISDNLSDDTSVVNNNIAAQGLESSNDLDLPTNSEINGHNGNHDSEEVEHSLRD